MSNLQKQLCGTELRLKVWSYASKFGATPQSLEKLRFLPFFSLPLFKKNFFL